MLHPSDLRPDQRAAILHILNERIGCITSDCGGGKTVAGLTSFKAIKTRDPSAKMLVICTPKGVKETWPRELRKWSQCEGLTMMCLNTRPAKRLKDFKEQEADIYVVSYQTLPWLLNNNKGRNKLKFTFVYADEGDCIKGPTSKFRSNLKKLSKDAEWRIVATATPKARDEDDYFGICDYLDGGKALKVENVTQFREKYMKHFVMPQTGVVIYRINKKKIKKLEKRIQHLFFNFENEDTVKVPIKVITHDVTLKKKSMKKYLKLRDEQCLNSIVMKDHVIDGVVHQVKDHDLSLGATTLSAKLAQLSSGFLYLDKNTRITPKMLMKTTNVKKLLKQLKQKIAVDVFDDRTKALKKLLKTVNKRHNDTPVVITYFFKHEKKQLMKILPEATCDTDEGFVDDFNNNKIKYLLLQYNRSSRSLNIQFGDGHVMVMYSPTFLWVNDYQIVRRLARDGQREPCVYCYRLYLTGTIDDVKAKRLDQRSVGHARFQKKIIRTIRGQ